MGERATGGTQHVHVCKNMITIALETASSRDGGRVMMLACLSEFTSFRQTVYDRDFATKEQ